MTLSGVQIARLARHIGEVTFLDTNAVYAESAIKQEGKIMTFEEFWENNYAKAFGECEPYYGIASHAFEAGQQNCNCVHTDNSAVIERLQEQIERLKFGA